MDKILSPFRQGRKLNTLFLSTIFISLHYALIIYVNSSFLSKFFSENQVSYLYIIGSIINTILLLNASKVLEKIGIYKFTIYAVVIEFIATFGLFISLSPFLVGLYFLTHLITISLLLFSFDILVEDFTKDNSKTGSIRATYLTITNITIFVSPILVAFLLVNNVYSNVYIISAVLLIPLYYMIKRLKDVHIAKINHIRLRETTMEYIKSKDLYNVFVTQFLLQLFYAFMIVYTPIYMSQFIGFSWSEIGIIFTVMLLPFVIFEIPVGELADYKYGEKEFMTIGFVIMGLATICVSFVTVKVFWIWALVLFMTRIGASFVEVTSDSYFFKRVDQEKTDVISFYRITRPLSFIIAPLIATVTLGFIPFQYMFIIIGSIMIVGAHYSLALTDTK